MMGSHQGSPTGSRGDGRVTAPPVMPGYGDAGVDTTRDSARDGTVPVASVMSDRESAHNVMSPARDGAVVDVAAPHHRDSDVRSARQGRVSSSVSRAESRYSSRSHTVGTTAPGTQFSRVQHLWRKRESTRRTSPSRSLSRQTLMLQESLTNVQGRLVEISRENRAALTETQDAASRALTAVHAELSQLHRGQEEQRAHVGTLQTELTTARRDLTERVVSADLQSRTRAVEQGQTVESLIRGQETEMRGAITQLQAELQTRDKRELEQSTEIARLRDEIAKANQARQSLQEYVDDVTAQLAPVDLPQMQVADAMEVEGDPVRVSDIDGLRMMDLHADRMQIPGAPVKQEDKPAPVVFATPTVYSSLPGPTGPPPLGHHLGALWTPTGPWGHR